MGQRGSDLSVTNVILPDRSCDLTWDIEIEDGVVKSLSSSRERSEAPAGRPSLLLPALCHPHIHLDKAYILTCNHNASAAHPGYTDLSPVEGTFAEALSNTSKAKERYTAEDLYLRGSQLLATSYCQGVTAMRAFVEIDHVTQTLALDAAVRLKRDFAHLVQVQICAFAQDPIFSTDHGPDNRSVIASALSNYRGSVDVLGTTPYVEKSREYAIRNIDWAVSTALEYGLHLDFHLDYNLASPDSSRPLLFSVLEQLTRHRWTTVADNLKTIVVGHCTQMTQLTQAELARMADALSSLKLPVHFVGLPTSDLYMMGRPNAGEELGLPHSRLRGTLQMPSMIRDFGLSGCLGVNNVGNAFTPYGSGDPLQLACMGVGLYHSGTLQDAETLYSCISRRAREAIGLPLSTLELCEVEEGVPWKPMLLVNNQHSMQLPGSAGGSMTIPARLRKDFKDVVWDPPEVCLRSIVH